ncbi:uncharacterized protein K452DRAFT_358647 [Aplosporella prunicola CBS 121167]|uniref:Uncharacterized protein n=1 Tax=Aplosporella prunicola CBS 121167 TaxID=1176127 RepID=A0A6A6BDE7_9PEZI|nr:uncharacterized protein K452DRAFT_358647 [Aplosporella prunicola CBS 121167]KAF2142212.1 hypothetical protein K452DRAFT_358647 [Aplosporella prunicola CBS 121167]
MIPILSHHCRACSYNTPVLFSASVFSQNHTCNYCGITSIGLCQRDSKPTETADMQQDELARLFSQSLNFSNTPQPVQQQPEPQYVEAEQMQHEQPSQQQQQQPIVYSSMHYTHSYHIQRAQSEPSMSSNSNSTAPSQPQPLSHNELYDIFSRHSIDMTALIPSQVALFQAASDDQKLRLLELWRIAPPTYGGQHELSSALHGAWPATSLQQEEQMARARYERMQRAATTGGWQAPAQQQQQQQQRLALQTDVDDMADDATSLTTASSPTSSALASPTPMHAALHAHAAEPYMLSGYEALAKRDYDRQPGAHVSRATDPVYDMENRYGEFLAMREYGGAGGWAAHGGDEEMAM